MDRLFPILLIIFDGLGDRAFPKLGGLTPLEAAKTPNLDRLAAEGASGILYPLGPGRIPSSERAHFAIFGYPQHLFPGRAVLEGLGHGREVPLGSVVSFAALRSVVLKEEGFFLQGWYREVEEEEARPLMAAVSPYEVDGLTFRLDYLERGEALLFIQGEASELITDSDPFFVMEQPIIRVQPLDEAQGSEAARRSAEALDRYLLWAHRGLEAHPINARRRAAGRLPFNFIVTKWTGRRFPLPSFEDRTGLQGASIASTSLYKGLASLLGLRFFHIDEKDPHADLAAKLARAADLLQQGFDFIHVHTKAADEAAHTHDPLLKKQVIEALDQALASLDEPLFREALVAVTADHSTPSHGPLIHAGDCVPIAIRGATVRKDAVTCFGERACTTGGLGQLAGEDILPVLLNLANRGLFLGSRPSPTPILCAPRKITPLTP